MAYGSYRLQFLHISDLHTKGPQEKEPWRRRRVLGDAWLRNLETLLAEEGRIDFVFFTGDAAQSGKPEEYAEVTSFLSVLREELDVPAERMFVVTRQSRHRPRCAEGRVGVDPLATGG